MSALVSFNRIGFLLADEATNHRTRRFSAVFPSVSNPLELPKQTESCIFSSSSEGEKKRKSRTVFYFLFQNRMIEGMEACGVATLFTQSDDAVDCARKRGPRRIENIHDMRKHSIISNCHHIFHNRPRSSAFGFSITVTTHISYYTGANYPTNTNRNYAYHNIVDHRNDAWDKDL